MYKQILCSVDGSPTSNCGMMEAIHLAKVNRTDFRGVHLVKVKQPHLFL